MHEIITLQLGQQSNYLATHFWNTQESYFTFGDDAGESPINHDVHFRPGLGADGTETFMPRTVIYDLKGGFGSMRKINALYEDAESEPAALWSGKTVVQKQTPIDISAYQESLDTGSAAPELTTRNVRYWSDFSRVFYHPRSIVQLNEYELGSTLMPFEKWTMGEELFASLDKDHDLLDRDLRPFIEEADQMQGVQIMSGIDDAWGGFAAKYVERMRDELGKTPIWLWGLQEPNAGIPKVGNFHHRVTTSPPPPLVSSAIAMLTKAAQEKRLLRLTNKARSIAELSSQVSLLIPLSIPSRSLASSVVLDKASAWNVTALFNAAMESTSLYTRLKSNDRANSLTMGSITDMLNVFGKQTIANLQMSPVDEPPAAAAGDGTGIQILSGRGELISSLNEMNYEDQSDTGGGQNRVESLDVDLSSLAENLGGAAVRGGSRKKAHLFSQLETARGDDAINAISREEDDEANDEDRYGRAQRRQKSHRYQSTLAYPMLDSYPRIFRDREGALRQDPISMRTVLSTDSSVMTRLRGLRTTVVRSIGLEDREDIGNELAEVAEAYKEGWSSGSDDDDDDN
ncbi:misato Segment II myosin-like domain-containing protein [Apiospora saccharicola]|uniref:Misato Segment II myosin-like domain-containing protein n=1 Tax=Apiospora saccharicola TaxID=335842 RepID=A0ABR1UF86_9PEZI